MLELFIALMLGAFVSGPVMWENLPTCDYRKPITARCREVKGQWGGTKDGRIVMPAGKASGPEEDVVTSR